MPSPPAAAAIRSPTQAPRRRLPPPDLSTMTFGRPNRPSTPIIGVITNQYQREWIVQQEKINNKRKKKEADALLAAKIGERQKGIRAQHTRASLGHMKVFDIPNNGPDTTAKFKHVEKKIQTKWEKMPGRRGQLPPTESQYTESNNGTTTTTQTVTTATV